ncbi:HNH endonuclease [Streptomyces phage Forrest]|nr:HNH endonuclease [Streptomyces phage Forrest]
MKRCRKCNRTPEETPFPKHPKFKDGLDSICKGCKAERQRNNYNQNRERILSGQKSRYHESGGRKYDLKRKFNMTLDEYNLMESKQNGVCAICGGRDEDVSLAVDHCHSTGIVRGLLCRKCNMGLGYFDDDIEKMTKAIAYLGEATR